MSDGFPESIEGAFSGFAQQGFDFGEHLLDGVEIGRIGRQIEDGCACGFDGLPDAIDLVACQIVADNDIAGP